MDVGFSMSNSAPGEEPPFELAKKVIQKFVQRQVYFYHTFTNTIITLNLPGGSTLRMPFVFWQVFAETKDELALVLFGTDSTKNQLDQDDQYQNITVHRHLMVPDFELLEEIENQIHPESQQADCILYDWYFLKDRCKGTSNGVYMLVVYVLLDFYCYLFASKW